MTTLATVDPSPLLHNLQAGLVTGLLVAVAIFAFAASVLFFRKVIGLDS